MRAFIYLMNEKVAVCKTGSVQNEEIYQFLKDHGYVQVKIKVDYWHDPQFVGKICATANTNI